jgi:hypothetical protein
MKNKIDNQKVTKKMRKFLIEYIRIIDESQSVILNYFHKNLDTVSQMKEFGWCNEGGGDIGIIIDSMNNQERNDLELQVLSWKRREKLQR